MTLDEVVDLLRQVAELAGGQTAWAREHNISQAYVSDVINRRREPGVSVLKALGLVKVTGYRRASG